MPNLVPSALPAPHSSLVTHTASELAGMIRSSEVSASEVVEAHCQRIQQVNAGLNAIVSPCLEQARTEAAHADQRQARGEPLGPLHGVPITIKDCFHVAGLPTTLGLPNWRDNIAPTDAPLVARLRAAGAIVLGKTNVPQLMLMHETDNPLFGRTHNPWNLERTAGGSSGGEAAAVAGMCSALGLGNDTGGSIRWPAHCCGLTGIKSTSRRLTRIGEMGALRGMEAVQAVAGPLARSVADLTLTLKVLVNNSPEQFAESGEVMGPLPDPTAIAPEKLRVGFWVHDGFFRPSPAIERAVREAAEALAARGVDCVEFQPPSIEKAMELYFNLLSADGSRDARDLLGNNRRDPRIARLIMLARIPSPLRAVACRTLAALGHGHAARLLKHTGAQSAAGYWKLCHERTAYQQEFWTAARAENIQAFLCPPFGLPALRHGLAMEALPAGSYAFLMNLLDAPAGVVPTTVVQSNEADAHRTQRDYIERYAAQSEQGSEGLPIGVQLASWPWREDIVLRLMQCLEESRLEDSRTT